MAFASLGDRGGNAIKVSGATITQNPTSDIPVGNILAVWVAWDNNNASTGDGPLSTQISCDDSVGNLYLEMFSGQATGATARAHGCIFITQVTNPITTGDTVTVLNHTSLKTAKAMSMWEFSMDGTMQLATTSQGPIQVTTNGADPAAITISSLTSRPYLLLHVLATEGPNTDTYTWDADYTQITQQGTSGGVDDTNMTVNGGFRIATLTTDTVNVTATTPTRDYTQGLQAIWEYDASAVTFPNTPVIDDFSRADIDPLPTPPWRANGSASGTRPFRNVSGTAGRSELVGTGTGGGGWWAEFCANNDQECYCTLSTLPGDGDLTGVIVDGDGDTAGSRSGLGYFTWETSPIYDRVYMGALGITGLPSPLWSVGWRNVSTGYKIGTRRIDVVHEHWINEGAGWRFVQAVDRGGSATGTGYIGAVVSDQFARIDDFGGGCGPFSDFTPQIYRRPFG